MSDLLTIETLSKTHDTFSTMRPLEKLARRWPHWSHSLNLFPFGRCPLRRQLLISPFLVVLNLPSLLFLLLDLLQTLFGDITLLKKFRISIIILLTHIVVYVSLKVYLEFIDFPTFIWEIKGLAEVGFHVLKICLELCNSHEALA